METVTAEKEPPKEVTAEPKQAEIPEAKDEGAAPVTSKRWTKVEPLQELKPEGNKKKRRIEMVVNLLSVNLLSGVHMLATGVSTKMASFKCWILYPCFGNNSCR